MRRAWKRQAEAAELAWPTSQRVVCLLDGLDEMALGDQHLRILFEKLRGAGIRRDIVCTSESQFDGRTCAAVPVRRPGWERRALLGGAFEHTGLAPASAESVVSSDALYLARDPGAATREAARLLVPGGVLVFNTYPPVGVDDLWLEVLRAGGFEVIEVDDRSAEWRDVMARKHRARLDHAAWLTHELQANAGPELAVSRAMLGVGRPSCLAATSWRSSRTRRAGGVR